MEVTLKDIMTYFDMTTSEFSKAWKLLTSEDKTQLKQGLSDGTLTY